MFFSICIPVYNTSKYLRECVDSVLSQTEKDYEIVLIDDGSTDDSAVICDEYADNYSNIRVVHKNNEGLMMTRRRGFKEAKGDYVLCLDSDDYYCRNDVLEKVRELIISKNCDLVIFNYIAGREKKEQDKEIVLLDLPNGYVFDATNKEVLYENFLCGKGFNTIWSKVALRKNVDIDVDYSIWKEDICRGEDRFQSFPILSNAHRIGYLKERMVYYRWTPSSISNNPKLKYYYAFRTIFRREDEYIEKWNLNEKIIRKRKLQRIPKILGIIVQGYHKSKETKRLEEWENFVNNVADDMFFTELFSSELKKDILLYYKLLHYLIVRKKWRTLRLVLDLYNFYSKKCK